MALPQGERPEYIANILLSYLSNATLKAVLKWVYPRPTWWMLTSLSRNCRSGATPAKIVMFGASSLRLVFSVIPSLSKIGSVTFEISLASASSKRIAVLPARTHVCWAKSFSVFLTRCVASFWSSALS
jgi:hypothetical protein